MMNRLCRYVSSVRFFFLRMTNHKYLNIKYKIKPSGWDMNSLIMAFTYNANNELYTQYI